MTYIAYVLTDNTRELLQNEFPPKYEEFVCHHITHKFPAKIEDELPDIPQRILVIGYADDGIALEALVVEIDGRREQTNGRPYHITHSIDRSKNRTPVMSNDLIIVQGYQTIPHIEIFAYPYRFES